MTKKSTFHLILKKDALEYLKNPIGARPQEMSLKNQLRFANEMLHSVQNFENILLSHGMNFHLIGQVDEQNCRYWSMKDPK